MVRDARLEKAVELNRERSQTLVEMAELCAILLREKVDLRSEASAPAVKKHLRPAALPLLEGFHEEASKLDEAGWTEAGLEAIFEAVCARNDDVKLGKLAQPVRVAVTGGPISPGIYETLVTIGRERCLARIQEAIALVRERAAGA